MYRNFYSKTDERLTAYMLQNDNFSTIEMADVCIKRLGDSRFIKKNGSINYSAFYKYAGVDSSTWNKIMYPSEGVPKRENIIKVIKALRLTDEEASLFLSEFGYSITIMKDKDLEIEKYIWQLNDKRFIQSGNRINHAAFCDYADINASVWDNIVSIPQKTIPLRDSVLKAIIALHLSREDAEKFLSKFGYCFNRNRRQERVIMTMLDYDSYTVSEARELLSFYGEDPKQPFISIYDTRDIIKERKKNGKIKK